MLRLTGVSYTHPNGAILLSDLNVTINGQDKIALAGNNGVGKSTLLQLMAGILRPSSGHISSIVAPYYVPQQLGAYNDQTIAAALHVKDKLYALHNILGGNVTEAAMATLGDDWNIEERCAEALQFWRLGDLALTRSMGTLSGGQKIGVLLAGIMVHTPGILLLDEPSNHLDVQHRAILYDYIRHTKSTLVVVSHDKELLGLVDSVYELDQRGLTVYGGNYEFYTAQKAIDQEAFLHDIHDAEKALRKAREIERDAMERQQKLDAHARKKQEKAGLPTISLNTFRNNAEKSTTRMKDVHAGKVNALATELSRLRSGMPGADSMRLHLDHSLLHRGRILITALAVNYRPAATYLWQHPINLEIRSGERIVIAGANGSGKTTLIKIILGQLQPHTGTVVRAGIKAIYADQEYSLVSSGKTVYEQVQIFNGDALQEHELKNRLSRFLFTKDDWDKSCNVLSGGEKMRLMLCCLTIARQAPDMIILDEPTNNLDLKNVEILTAAINEYRGTLLIVTHDAQFAKQIGIERVIDLA